MGNHEWFASSFADDYIRIYQHRDKREAARILDQLLALVELPHGVPCLDLCCGFGRHLLELRRRGLDATGVDLSMTLLAHAAQHPELRGYLCRADMRALPFAEAFRFVFSFFTSFGYFADDRENALAIAQIARCLKPGGGFMIDFLNPSRERRNLIPLDIRHTPDFTLTQHRWIDYANRSVDKQLIIEDAHGSRSYRESVKLYGPEDFQDFCEGAGLVIDRFLGTPSGAPFTVHSPRLIIVGHKPGGGS